MLLTQLLSGSHALATLEVVQIGTSGACGGADPSPTSPCFHDACKLLQALAQVLVRHLQVHRSGPQSTCSTTLAQKASNVLCVSYS